MRRFDTTRDTSNFEEYVIQKEIRAKNYCEKKEGDVITDRIIDDRRISHLQNRLREDCLGFTCQAKQQGYGMHGIVCCICMVCVMQNY